MDAHRKMEFYGDLIERLESELAAECRAVSPAELMSDSLRADLVVLNDETWPFTGASLPGLHRRAIPTLHLADGILEWRNTWENPQRASQERGMPLFQPVLADKIACLGRSQARHLESWGNIGKCEITGSPRLDGILRRPVGLHRTEGPIRILITTARSPGFTQQQVDSVRASLRDLADWFDNAGSSYEPVWRVAPEVDEAVSGGNTMESASLSDQLQTADAMISCPSTVQLEGMKAGIPVALLDYGNRPAFVSAAWSITATDHIDEIVPALANPTPERMSFQDLLLYDSLECRTPATPRVVTLANAMVESGQKSRADGTELRFERCILPDTSDEAGGPTHQRASMHPNHPVFAETNVAALQAEVGHLPRAMRLSPTQTLYRVLCRVEARMLRVRKGIWR